MSEFQLPKLKKKTPLWKDMLHFCIMVIGVWGSTHLVMNYSAYTEIMGFRYKTLQSSVVADLTEMQTQEKLGNQSVVIKKNKVRSRADVFASAPKLEKVKETVTFRKKELKPKNQAKLVFEKMPVYPSDNRLVIPRIGKNVPLITVPRHRNWQKLENTIQKGLQNGVVVHPVSADPGNFGNFFLTGHSSYYTWDKGRYKDVFALLHEVKVNDIVEIYWEGKKYTYKMEEKKVVKPTAVEILEQPDDRKEITLMTCTPIGTNKNRLILVGRLESVE